MIEHHHPIVRGATSNIIRVLLTNSSSTPGTGLTGLSYVSAGLSISVQAHNESSPTTYTVASSKLEAIAALGTFATPTATKCRFAEIDATNSPGMYEIHLDNARFSVTDSQYIDIVIKGATNLRQATIRIPLTALNPYDPTRAGLSALPNASAAGTGGLMINGTNTGTPTFSDGFIINQSATNGSALVITGNGTGSGIAASGGTTGNGAVFQSGTGATGSGLLIEARSTNGNGITTIGTGVNHGIQTLGGATSGYGMYVLGRGTGSGIVVESGAGSTGNGITIMSSSTNGHGLNITATGTGDGIRCLGGPTSGNGIRCTGGGTGNGIYAVSGGGATGNGIYGAAASTNGSGMFLTGTGNYSGLISSGGSGGGSGAYFIGSGSGNGIQASGGATNGHGLYVFAQGTGNGAYLLSGSGATGDGIRAVAVSTNGNGMYLAKAGTGKDLHAPVSSLWQTLLSDSAFSTSNSIGEAWAASLIGNVIGTCQSGSTSTTIKLATGASSSDDYYKDSVVVITSGTGERQTRRILSYVGSTRVATVDVAWVTTPDNTSKYLVLGRIV